MSLQYSVAVRDAQNDAAEATIGSAPTLDIRTGAPPASCAAANSGVLIATGSLPSDWLTDSASGTKTKAGAWAATGLPAAGTGIAGGHFRIMAGATCHMQGTFGVGADMAPDNNSIADAQVVNVSLFSITRGNA